jgi:hypothetical protein
VRELIVLPFLGLRQGEELLAEGVDDGGWSAPWAATDRTASAGPAVIVARSVRTGICPGPMTITGGA